MIDGNAAGSVLKKKKRRTFEALRRRVRAAAEVAKTASNQESESLASKSTWTDQRPCRAHERVFELME